jgi:chromosome segregation protein
MARIRLQSIKLSGFKSFPDEVELGFPSDVSAIIGPNGCGKSNLVDAILWVLGEQSPSLLRLKQMGEVVFSGAAGRKPAGAAEVTLQLQSDDGHWPETDGRMEIRRRVFRSGPSEYRLNGKVARLKDVVDELIGVGLGTRNYSIIEQGRVGQVLSARPTDRRVLIEEAAGITRYKKRRHESELKLEHTRQNLLRLDDVISEVERSLRQIKRQAGQARRHQRLQDELKEKLDRLLTLEAHQLDGARRDVARRRAQTENEVVAAAAALGSAESDLTQARNALETTREEVEGARLELSDLLTSRERLEAFLERSADLIDNLRETLTRTRHDATTLASSRSELEERIAEAKSRQTTLDEALETVRRTAEEAEQAAEGARNELQKTEQAAADRRQELLRTISSLTASRNRLGELEREQDRLAYTLSQLDHEQGTLGARIEDVGARYRAAAADSQSATAGAEELEARRRELADQRSSRQEEVVAAKRESESLGAELWELRHRLAGVERELARRTAETEQLTDLLPADALAGQVSDYLDPEPGLAPLFDRLWSDWLELPVVNTTTLSEEQLEMAASLEGRLRLAVAAEAPSRSDRPTPEGAEALIDRAGVSAEHLPWLSRVLPPAYRCEDAEHARSLAEQHPDSLFVGPDAVVWRGRTMEPETVGSRHHGALVLRDDQQRLQGEIDDLVEREAASAANHRELAGQLSEIGEALDQVDVELVSAEQERARATAVEQSLGSELSRLRTELGAARGEHERSQGQQGELSTRQKKLEQELAGFEKRTAELEQAVEDATTELDGRREELSEAARRLERWRAEARLAEERSGAATGELERLEGEQRRLEERGERLEADVEKLTAELSRTEDEVVRSRTRLTEETGLLSSAQDREGRLGDGIQKAVDKVDTLDREVRQRRAEHDCTREDLHAIEVEQTRLDAEWDRLRDVAASELDTTPEKLAKATPDDGVEPEVLRENIEDLRGKLEKLGPVNLLALKEVDELQERSTFLTEQRKDLVEALRKLDATIKEIDAFCTERFVDTLEKVNTVLHETFSRLFGGGSAFLQLVDEDDPLESGIDITAQPPGKKTQSVALLSGGEKALTALSLLISLFRIKPSPFCILDEVDAPLDDANVERFSDLIHSMTDHTQFVLITHNRRTMARANVLYGVTMEEPGVSKTVSVRLEE